MTSKFSGRGAVLVAFFLFPRALPAQVVNPADTQVRPDEAKGVADPWSTERLRSWELPPVTVEGERVPELFEEQRIGSYQQPRWTATRRFPTTRVYVVPEGKVEFEYWLRPTFNRDGTVDIRSLWELEFGLPYRFQLDLYLRTDQTGDESEFLWGQQVELRWALADWGVIWGNPTLYLEWVGLEQRPDKIEPKLLLGGEIVPRWHWGVNLVAEIEMGGEQEHEYQLTGGVSYAIIDSRLALGIETIFQLTDTKEDRGDFEESFLIGPSIQVRPLPQATFNFAPLIGIGGHSPEARLYVNFGWEF
jgi:hypothetical protein